MDFHKLFIQPYESYSTFQIVLEIVAATFGLFSVYFSTKKNIWVYPTGIISTALYVYILLTFGLLGDMLINVYYTIMSIYGWILWSKNTEDHIHVPVSWTTNKEWKQSVFLFIFSIIFVTAVYYFKPSFEGSNNIGFHHLDWANWTDIVVTAIFLVGMWLMAKRRIENWIFWIIGDIICVPMMLYKGLGITSVQYLVFTVMAIYGYLNWKKNLNK